MKIAVACDGLSVSTHAARCDSYMCYSIEKGIIKECRNLPNMGVTSHEGAQLVKDLGFDALISGGIDMDMANELCDANIEVVAGVSGSPLEVVQAYLNHTLMGAIGPCGVDSDEDDLDDAFAEIEQKMKEAV